MSVKLTPHATLLKTWAQVWVTLLQITEASMNMYTAQVALPCATIQVKVKLQARQSVIMLSCALACAGRCVQSCKAMCLSQPNLAERHLAEAAMLLAETMLMCYAPLLLLCCCVGALQGARLAGWPHRCNCLNCSTHRSRLASVCNLKRYHYCGVQCTTDHSHNTRNLWRHMSAAVST